MTEADAEGCDPITVRVEIDGIVVQRRAELRVLEYDHTGRATISCMAPIIEEGELLVERIGEIPFIVRMHGAGEAPKAAKTDSVRHMQVTVYRDHIIRTVFGQRPALLFKEVDSDALGRVCERLADAEDAKRIMRNKGYGQPWTSLVELARLLPDANARKGAVAVR
ncbi:hypothetical protein [Massilia sp. Leaf139]|uniref:hypothetical protein n=1 Tax=Massilia sp. Leaf139 TaxID=1736272 RepID=UPI0006F59A69|nr:hypothetical protein [Massilia sp. Leaf139]KQQ93638.1 hypothetical protein ASF77_22400 [Massilia sp. Leaf139]